MTKTMIDRRTMLLAGGATIAASALPGTAWAAASGDAGDRLARDLDVFADEILVLAPEMATSLGVDNGPRTALKSQLDQF